MHRSKCTLCLLAFAFWTCCTAGRASVYTDRVVFDTAVAADGLSLVIEDFDGLATGTVIMSGSSQGGMTFQLAGDAFDLFVNDAFDTTSGGNSLGVDASAIAEDNYFIDGDAWSLSFAPTRAVGLYFITSDPLFAGDITLTTDTAVAATNSDSPDSAFASALSDGGFVYFVGVVESTPFSAVDVSSIGGGLFVYTADDVVRATTAVSAIPEAASQEVWQIGLVTLGIAGWARRRRIRVTRKHSE